MIGWNCTYSEYHLHQNELALVQNESARKVAKVSLQNKRKCFLICQVVQSSSFQGQQSPECYLCFVSMVCLIFWKCFVICHIVQWGSFPQFSVTKSSPAVLRASRMLFVFCALYLWFALYFASCPVAVFHSFPQNPVEQFSDQQSTTQNASCPVEQFSTVFHKVQSSSFLISICVLFMVFLIFLKMFCEFPSQRPVHGSSSLQSALVLCFVFYVLCFMFYVYRLSYVL